MKIQTLLLILTMGLFSISLECVAQNNSNTYKSDVSKYSIEFPSEFSNLDEENNMHGAKSGDLTYMAYHGELKNQYLIEENKSNTLLVLLYDGVQNNLGAKVVSQENITINGYTGKRAILESEDISGYYYIFIDLDKGYVYHLVVVGVLKSESFDAESAEKFANTFKILAS